MPFSYGKVVLNLLEKGQANRCCPFIFKILEKDKKICQLQQQKPSN